MNKNGFTLVELLAVIIILSLLAIIANNSVTNVISNSKSDLYNAQIKLIETAAENWGVDNLNKLPDSGNCSYITLKDLKDYGMFEDEIINPKTNKEFSNDLIIKITSKTNDKGELISNYEISPSNVKNCNYVYPPVCTLVNDADSSGTITAGDAYNCKVKEEMEVEYPNGYTFYVLTTPNEKDNHVDFIMNQNINSDGTPAGMTAVTQATNPNQYNLVAWYSEDNVISATNNYGPITAMKFAYYATKDWINIPALNYVYKDREYQNIPDDDVSGYVSFVSNSGIATITPLSGSSITIGTKEEPLRVRMPIYSAEMDEGIRIQEKGEVLNKKSDNSNSFLYNNLISYWTLSSVQNSYMVWFVDDISVVNEIDSIILDFGVRPVITLPKRLISN